MVDDRFVAYFRRWIDKGYSVDQIKMFLLRQGYPVDVVDEAAVASRSFSPVVSHSLPIPNHYRKTLTVAAVFLTVFILFVVAYFIVDKDINFIGSDNETLTIFSNSTEGDDYDTGAGHNNTLYDPSKNVKYTNGSTNSSNITNLTTLTWSSSGGGGSGGSSSEDEEEPAPSATCFDGILNQDETGVDCGGSCDACPLCLNGIQDENETGVDCGGSCIACPKYLVQNSTGYADIIVSPTAPNMTILAANYFQMYIYNMTNVSLPISNIINDSQQYHVYIGQSNYTDALNITDEGCEYGGFKIVSEDNYLALLGDDTIAHVPGFNGVPGPHNDSEWDALTGIDTWDNEYLDYYSNSHNSPYNIWEEDKRGSMNAVYEFMYGQGIRWYHPGWYEHPRMGTIMPAKENITFYNSNSTINPDFDMREFYIYSMGFGYGTYHYDGQFDETFQWLLSLRGDSYYEFLVGSLGGPGHGIRAVVARTETESAHPEYYATLDGVLMNGSNPVPNLCSPELLEANIRYVKTMFDIYNVSMVSVMPTDGFSQASDDCAYMEEPERGWDGILSNYVWNYTNNLAWAIYDDGNYTDKRIFAGAYTTYQLPPTELGDPRGFAPNIAVVITKWRTDLGDEETKEHFQNLTTQWYDLLPSHEVYTYDYYLHNNAGRTTQGVPVYFPQLISEDLKFLKNISRGEMIEISSTSTFPPYLFNESRWLLEWDAFAANSLNTYVTARLYWNASQDVDALLEEYYNLYYGPANNSMKALIEYSEANSSYSLIDPSIIRTMRQMLTDARAIAGDTIYGERIDLVIGLMDSNYEGDEVLIDSCRDLNSSTTTYKLTSNVSSADTCFSFDTVGITLDCQGHTITYDTGISNASYAIRSDWQKNAITIKNCTIQSAGNSTAMGVYISRSIDTTIVDSRINTKGTCVWFVDMDGINITRTTMNSTSSVGLSTQNVVDGAITDNNLSSISNRGIYLYDTHNSIITNNTLSSNSSNGADISVTSDNLTFADNTFVSNSSYGFNMAGSNSTILLNTVISNSSYGLMASGYNNIFNSNNMRSNSSAGVFIAGLNITFISNIAISASDEGFRIQSSNNTIINQTAIGGMYGIGIWGGARNSIIDSSNISGGSYDIYVGWYAGGFNNSVVNCSFDSEYVNAGGGDILRRWYLDYHVTNSSGNVSGANVSSYNSSGLLAQSSLTDAQGRVRQELIEYVNNGTRKYSTPHVINVSKTGYTTNTTTYNLSASHNIFATVTLT